MAEENDDGRSKADDNVESAALTAIDKVAPSGWQLKLAKVSAQLLVGTRAGAAVYAEAREHLDEIEGRSAMNKQLFATATQQILNDPEMVERAKARLVGGMLRKQENLEAVIDGAANRMQALPSPDQFGSDPENQQPADSETSMETDEPLNSDWAATFTEVAENATSEELRERLSRVLVGEISSDGMFPRATIRAIAELERSDLEGLIAVLPFAHGNAIIKDDSISEKTLELLGECGLADYNSMLGHTATLSATPDSPAALAGREWAIVMEVSETRSISIPTVPLTRVGKSVITLLDQFDERSTLKNFVDHMDKNDINKVIIGNFVNLPDNKIKIVRGKRIFPNSVYYNISSTIDQ
ncbi:MAG: DUF2806 domain-containing protein [Novosphingobium sp.]|nr:DUF2806 domain-containing protein [Novosphingobium sp.]